MNKNQKEFAHLISMSFRPHPWHGVSPGDNAPDVVTAFVENVPTDTVKHELNKQWGHLAVDRPQLFSSMCPMLYGYIPQTYCGDKIGAFCDKQTKRKGIKGDGDPLDICVLTEKDFAHGDVFVRARPIGGLRMIDGGQADDKIIAVMDQDVTFGHITDISQLPEGIIKRLRHYFLTYKQLPDQPGERRVEITHAYGREEALEVIRLSAQDYVDSYGHPEQRLERLRQLLMAAVKEDILGNGKGNGKVSGGKGKDKGKKKNKKSPTKPRGKRK